MINHEDPEVGVIVRLLEQQRDYAMGTAAALAKENAQLKAQVESLLKDKIEDQRGA